MTFQDEVILYILLIRKSIKPLFFSVRFWDSCKSVIIALQCVWAYLPILPQTKNPTKMGIDVNFLFHGLKIGAIYLPLFPSFLKKMLQYIPSYIAIPLRISRPNLIESVNNKSSSSAPYFSYIRIHFDSYTFIQ